MKSRGIPLITFPLIVNLMTALSNDKYRRKIANFDCFTDYDKQLFCSWEVVNSSSTCREDFQLIYTNNLGMTNICKTMENDHYQGFKLLNKCVCNITLAVFLATDNITMEVTSYGQSVNKTSIAIYTKVKPKPPSNVRVDLSDSEMGVVTWDINYDYTFIKESLSFQVQILSKKDHKVALEYNHTQPKFQYVFNKRQLTREDYVVRIRAKPAEGTELKGYWSEWSPEVIWRNEYDLTIVELKNIIIPVFCSVILCLILLCYFVISRSKKKWWNNIPDPSKSTIYQDRLKLKEKPEPDHQKKNVLCSCFSRLISSIQKTKAGPQVNSNKQHSDEKMDLNKFIFKPEEDDVESCVELCPKATNKSNPDQEERLHDSTDDHLPEVDLSIARMFYDILEDSSDFHMGTLANSNVGNTLGIFCWPKKLNRYAQDQMKAYELHPELGFHQHHNSYNEFNTKLDDATLTSNYTNFDGSLKDVDTTSEHRSVSISGLDSLSLCSSHTNSLGKSQSISYYNTELCLCSNTMEDKRPQSTAAQPEISQSTAQSHKHPESFSKGDHVAPKIPSSCVCQEPRYESQKRASEPQSFIKTDQQCTPLYVDKQHNCDKMRTFEPQSFIETDQGHAPLYMDKQQNCDQKRAVEPQSFIETDQQHTLSYVDKQQNCDQKRAFEPQSFIETDQQHVPFYVDKQQTCDHVNEIHDLSSACQVFGYQRLEQADQNMSRNTDFLGFNSDYQPFQSPASSYKKGCLSEPDSDDHAKDNYQKNLKPSNDRQGFSNDRGNVVLSPRFHLGVYCLNYPKNTVMGGYHPSSVCNILGKYWSAADIQSSEMTLNDRVVAYASTFDIGNHLRNLRTMHGPNMQFKNLATLRTSLLFSGNMLETHWESFVGQRS